jgi:hypothetical protein
LTACRKYGPVFKFKLTSYEMTTVVDYEAVRSLLQLGDSKVCGCAGLMACPTAAGTGAGA